MCFEKSRALLHCNQETSRGESMDLVADQHVCFLILYVTIMVGGEKLIYSESVILLFRRKVKVFNPTELFGFYFV